MSYRPKHRKDPAAPCGRGIGHKPHRWLAARWFGMELGWAWCDGRPTP